MKGDFTRDTFKPEKHYRQVLMQQGRVQLDADWNEQAAIGARRHETTTGDVVGHCGGPADNAAFGIVTRPADLSDADYAALREWVQARTGTDLGANKAAATLGPGDLILTRGRYYVDGIQCELELPVLLSAQPDLTPGPLVAPAAPATTQNYLLYLDVWQRHLTVLDDERIREPALGGPDTATRVKTVWQVRAKPTLATQCAGAAGELDGLRRAQLPQLKARTAKVQPDTDPCALPASAGYRGLENQLYRVEIHAPGAVNAATFKWSRENGSVVTAITDFTTGPGGTVLTVASTGPDDVLGFKNDDIVELLDDDYELNGLPGKLAVIDGSPANNKIKLKPHGGAALPLPADIQLKRHAKLRRWEGVVVVSRPAENEGYRTLENHVEIRFDTDGDGYRTGDYWLIAARTATADATSGDIEWPRELDANGRPQKDKPLPQPPAGITHHYCRLGIITVLADRPLDANAVQDCRCLWPALATVPRLFYVSGDGQEVMPDLAAPADTHFKLPRPLIVGVANAHCLERAFSVRFDVVNTDASPSSGLVVATATGGAPTQPFAIVLLDAEGLAKCDFHLDGIHPVQQVTARLLDANGTPVSLPLIFNANLSMASRVAFDPSNACRELSATRTVQEALRVLCELRHREPGIVVQKVELPSRQMLLNDSDVHLADFISGINVFCDGVEGGIDPVSVSRATVFVTVEAPLDSGSPNSPRLGGPEFGFQPVILAGVVQGERNTIRWSPTDLAKTWLRSKVPDFLPNVEGHRLLVRLTLKGNFIWDVKNPDLFLDGDVFGRKRHGLGPDVTQPTDDIVASSLNSPGSEGVANAIDDQPGFKYLNFDRLHTGFTVTPSVGPTVVNGLTLTSANDAPERDPATYLLEGSQDGINFTFISGGPVPAFAARFQKVTIPFPNDTSYLSYRLIFPEVVGPGGNSMQISEVEFLSRLLGQDRTDLRLMPGEAGDGRRGGDFEMWFWLTDNELIQPPLIILQPVSFTRDPGIPVTFQVQASGTPPLLFQWFGNGSAIPGATNSSYTTANRGTYFVEVSNSAGTARSTQVELRVVGGLTAGGGAILNANRSADFDARVFRAGGQTRVGAGFVAQLLLGESPAALKPAGTPRPFLTGTQAGLWRSETVTLPDVPPGATILAQVRVWPGDQFPTFEAALAAGAPTGTSDVFEVTTGGAGTPHSGTLERMSSFRLTS
jgi:hypothetical protein